MKDGVLTLTGKDAKQLSELAITEQMEQTIVERKSIKKSKKVVK
jgi:hypothetical protein